MSSCAKNGISADGPTQLFYQNASCVNGLSESIALNVQLGYDIQMLQININWEAVPVTSEDIVLWKDSNAGPLWDTEFLRIDPSAAGESLTDLVCVIPWVWSRFDYVRIDYPNTDDQNVGVEFYALQIEHR